jgi:hypothetical protein
MGVVRAVMTTGEKKNMATSSEMLNLIKLHQSGA